MKNVKNLAILVVLMAALALLATACGATVSVPAEVPIIGGHVYDITASGEVNHPDIDVQIVDPITSIVPITPITPTVAPVTTCGYSPSFLTEVGNGDPDVGLNRAAGAVIPGPAIAQLDRSNAVVIYPGASWTTGSDVVAWEYQGDTKCLEAQLVYFPGKNFTRIH